VLSLALDKKVPFVPGVGPTLLTKIWLAFDIDHADAGTIEVPMTLTPQASPANPVSLGDARWKVVELDYDPGQDLSTTELELSITQTDLSTSPLSTYTEAHPLDAEKLRLKPSIFRDVMLIVRIERDPPV
jgi:hypothetical protein